MPLSLTVSCFSKIQIGFTFLVPAHLGSPGKKAVKRVLLLLLLLLLLLFLTDDVDLGRLPSPISTSSNARFLVRRSPLQSVEHKPLSFASFMLTLCQKKHPWYFTVAVALHFVFVWPGGATVRLLARGTKGRGFDSRPFLFQETTLGKLFTHMCLCHQAV